MEQLGNKKKKQKKLRKFNDKEGIKRIKKKLSREEKEKEEKTKEENGHERHWKKKKRTLKRKWRKTCWMILAETNNVGEEENKE